MFPAPRVPATLAALLLSVTALSACGNAGTPAAAQGITGNDMIATLATQLGSGGSLAYSARYHLAGGGTASIDQAQDPLRAAYVYPGGRVITEPDTVTACTGATCTRTAAAADHPNLFGPATDRGFVTPATVRGLLDAAALDSEVTLDQHDTTIAGRHATCIELGGVSEAQSTDFTACVTIEGALGSFTGTYAGKKLEMTMTHYENTPAETAFTLPANATLTERR